MGTNDPLKGKHGDLYTVWPDNLHHQLSQWNPVEKGPMKTRPCQQMSFTKWGSHNGKYYHEDSMKDNDYYFNYAVFLLNRWLESVSGWGGIIIILTVWFQVKCFKQGIKNRNSVLKRVGQSAIFVLNRVRVWGAAPHLPTQGYIESPLGGNC